MKLIQPIFLSSLFLLSLTACSPNQEKPQAANKTVAQTPSASELQAQAMSTDTDAKFTDNVDQGDTNAETTQAVQEQFEVRARREPSQSTMTGYVDKLDIISLNNDPTTLTGVLINRGNCRTKGFYDYQNMRYGSVAQVYLGCAAEYVREVTISTNSGLSYTYNF